VPPQRRATAASGDQSKGVEPGRQHAALYRRPPAGRWSIRCWRRLRSRCY